MRENKLRLVVVCALSVLVGSGLAGGALVPVGDYELTLERTGWSATRTMNVQPFPTSEPFYTVGGQDVDVYLQDLGEVRPGISEYTWYVNAPEVLNDPVNLGLLGGSGPLTISVSGMELFDTVTNMTYTSDSNVMFIPQVTHIYYVGYDDSYEVMHLPGEIPVNTGISQMQRSPVRPLDPITEAVDFAVYGSAYGTAYQDTSLGEISFVLPDMYVPDSVPDVAIWELSFGAGFVTIVPEPSVIMLLLLGGVFLRIRRK